MAFSYGFYNSLNGDRKYDSEDISRMFDGILMDGIVGAVGDTFAVNASSGTVVTVASGRAWFNHTCNWQNIQGLTIRFVRFMHGLTRLHML